MPGSIVSYDPDTQTASVQPMLTDPRRDLTSGEPIFEPWGVMQGVPVMWPRMGDYVIVGFLKPNDQVVLEAWDLDPSAWQEQERSQKPVNPRSLRRLGGNHWRINPTDLTAPGGRGPNKSAPTSPGLVIGLDNGQTLIEIDGTNIKLGHAATDPVALSSKVATELAKIATTLSSLTGATFGTPYTPGSVAATITKAK